MLRSPEFLSLTRAQGCFWARLAGTSEHCLGATEAHHYGRGGMAIKCSDFETVALCHHHHMHWHQHGTLPGAVRLMWLERFEVEARRVREIFHGSEDVF